jgi:hypothetical protein
MSAPWEWAKLRTSYGSRLPNSAHINGQSRTAASSGSRSINREGPIWGQRGREFKSRQPDRHWDQPRLHGHGRLPDGSNQVDIHVRGWKSRVAEQQRDRPGSEFTHLDQLADLCSSCSRHHECRAQRQPNRPYCLPLVPGTRADEAPASAPTNGPDLRP